MAKYPMTTINASGMAVGLPEGQMGNSEAVSYTHLLPFAGFRERKGVFCCKKAMERVPFQNE